MNAFAAVHNLGDTQIGSKAQQRISLITIETGARANQIDHKPQCDDHAVIKVGVERHGDHMRGRFGERPFEAHIGANCKPERPNEPSLNGSDANLTVALRAMPISHGKKGAIIENGKIQSGASDKFFVIEISAILAWRQSRDSAPFHRGCYCHNPKKRPQRNVLAPGQPSDHTRLVERNKNWPVFGKVVRKRTGEGPNSVISPIVVEIDRLDINLQRLSSSCAPHRNRTSAHMSKKTLWSVSRVNRGQRGWNIEWLRWHQFGPAWDRRNCDTAAPVD